jgi:hypothetical protein
MENNLGCNGRKIKLNYMHRWFNGKDAMYAVCSYEGDTNNVRRVIPGFFCIDNFLCHKTNWLKFFDPQGRKHSLRFSYPDTHNECVLS